MSENILVSGFTFIKNGLTLGYPIRESIESIEALTDEIIINVGFNNPELTDDDGTYKYLSEYFTHPKFKFIKSYWDPELMAQGLILSEQTNIALKECSGKYCLYIQGDEIIHEDDYPEIHNQIIELENSPETDGLIFKYLHFYGNVDVIKYTRNIYRREVRLVRNHKGIKSWLDAQGFRHQDNTKIKAKQIDSRIFHYGWARQEQVMRNKVKTMDKFYHGNNFEGKGFNYERIWGLKKFKQTHPKVMDTWIKKNKNDLDILSLPPKHEFKNLGLMFSDLIELLTNYRIGEYKNFKEIK